MADVKWIKLAVALPSNRQLKQIRKLPEGNTIALLWVFLMCLAGDVNDNGMIYLTPEIPYNEEMLADEFDMDTNTVRLGLETFQRFGLIDIVDNFIHLSSWEKWQSTDKLAEMREYNRLAQQKSRAKKKLLENVNDKSMTSQPCQDIEEDIETEKDKKRERIDYNAVFEMYNSICISLPKVTQFHDARKRQIKSRLKEYSLEQIKEVFTLAEKSSFLSGKSGSWQACFDWLMKSSNFVKVLEGNYNDKNESCSTQTEINNSNTLKPLTPAEIIERANKYKSQQQEN